MKARLFQLHQAIEQQLIWNQPEVDLLELEENKEQNFNLPVNQTG